MREREWDNGRNDFGEGWEALGEGNGNPLQYSCLENSMDKGAWWATVHGVAKSHTRLSAHSHTDLYMKGKAIMFRRKYEIS